MNKMIVALAFCATLAPLAVHASAPEPGESQEAKWARLAQQTKPGPCPTEVEVLPYVWIEPSTGMEYTALRLHCPGRDDLNDEPNVDNNTGNKARSPATSSG